MKPLQFNLKSVKKISQDDESTTFQHQDGHIIKVSHKPLSKKYREELKSLPMHSGDKAAHYAEGTPDAPVSEEDLRPSAGSTLQDTPEQIAQEAALNAPAPPPEQLQSLAPIPEGSGDGLAQASAQMAGMQPPAAGATPQQAEPSLLSGYQQQMQGLGEQQQGESQIGNEQAAQLQQRVAGQDKAIKDYDNHFQQLESERQGLMHDVKNGFVNPNHYWDNHSKIATGLGIILAGFNPTNSPNGALEFLKSNIERDTQAQMANLGAKQNLLSHTMQQFGNVKDAAAFTNQIKADQLSNELRAAAAKATDPMTQARYHQLAGQLQQSTYPNYLNTVITQAYMKQAMQPGGGNAEQMLPLMRLRNPEMAKEMESRLIPGVGMATVPVPDPIRDEITKKTNIIKASQNLRKFIDDNTVSGKLSPAHRGQGEALAGELQQLYRQGVGASTSESEKNTITNIIGDSPGGFLSSYTQNPKLKALEGSINTSLNTIKSQHGLPTTQYKTVGGKQYMRGPNGEAIEVK